MQTSFLCSGDVTALILLLRVLQKTFFFYLPSISATVEKCVVRLFSVCMKGNFGKSTPIAVLHKDRVKVGEGFN